MGGQRRVGLGVVGPGHEHRAVAAGQELADDRRHLCRRLARAVDDLGHALAQRPVVVDPGEPEVGPRQPAQGLDGLVGRDLAGLHGLEQLAQRRFIHSGADRKSVRCRPSERQRAGRRWGASASERGRSPRSEQRSGWDSNPRALAGRRFSRPLPSSTRPPLHPRSSHMGSSTCPDLGEVPESGRSGLTANEVWALSPPRVRIPPSPPVHVGGSAPRSLDRLRGRANPLLVREFTNSCCILVTEVAIVLRQTHTDPCPGPVRALLHPPHAVAERRSTWTAPCR